MKKANVFDVKKFAIHDGPGIRTTFFLKGCPLDCWWCHNPESKAPNTEHIQNDSKGFQIGALKSVSELVDEALKDEIFYRQSKGGVTLSGGEPMMQPEFCLALLQELKKQDLHTAIDTCGFAKTEFFKQVISFTDLFLYDIKFIDVSEHKKYTGVHPEIILKNLDLLLSENCDIEIRIPLIPGITDTKENLKSIRNYLLSKGIYSAVALPYNYFVEDKLKRFRYQNKIGELKRQSGQHLTKIENLMNTKKFNLKIEK